ncbi:MAG: hypothetical protein ACOYD3_13870, partial [Kiritimatiellia bacterium]
LTRYLVLKPNDWQGWIDLATLRVLDQDMERAQMALRKAIETGRQHALQVIESDPRLRQLAIPLLQQMSTESTAGRGFGLPRP